MFQILNSCSTDLSSCCSDYVLAKYLYIIKSVITVIQIIVPIILIVMGIIQLISLVVNPEDGKGKSVKGLINKFIAAAIVFLVPIIINLVLELISISFDSFELGKCWENAEVVAQSMNN